MKQQERPKVITLIVILSALTITRTQAILFLPTLEMYGGNSPNAWLAPWITDSILGVLLPVVIYFLLKGSGVKTWAVIAIYSAIGAFDYATGLVTQWLHPLPPEVAESTLVFTALIATLIFQLSVVVLLFRKDVRRYFIRN
ncbi:MAG: hypothetical protein AAFN81_19560 [Bacteroidota bacterium]